MSERSATNHLERERLSALLEQGGGDAEASAHLEVCTDCRAEFEWLSRMRMALSGLGGLDPPVDEWLRVERALEERGVLARSAGGGLEDRSSEPSRAAARRGAGSRPRLLARWPVQAAAAFLLFAGGIVAGLQLTAGGPRASGRLAGGPPAVREGAGSMRELASPEAESEYLEALAALDRLRAPRVQAAGGLDPASAAERIARLEALIQATREAVRESPADPVANALLFQLVEERDQVASRLNESLHLTTLEYR